jgi:trimethylamine-N-oxide reductase (cytochrome c)
MTEKILTSCTVGGATFVHVKDGKITKVRPIVFDETDAPAWTIEARGKNLHPASSNLAQPFHRDPEGQDIFGKPIQISDEAGRLRPQRQSQPAEQGQVGLRPDNLDELRRQYPETFNRPIDRASGLRFERVLAKQGGKQ